MHKNRAAIMIAIMYCYVDVLIAGSGCSKPMRHPVPASSAQDAVEGNCGDQTIQDADEKPAARYLAIDAAIEEQSSHCSLGDRAIMKANLDTMPSAMLGKILGYVCDQVGTQGMINKADLPVIVKNITHVASVNHNLRDHVNSLLVTNMVIESMAQRFKMQPLDVAAVMKTKGAQAWLHHYVHTSGDYELFKAVQDIFAICRDLCEQVKPYGVFIDDGQIDQPGVNPYHEQMKQGLQIVINSSSPDRLCTPWGQARLLDCTYSSGSYIVRQEFLKKITAYFESVGNEFFDSDHPQYYEQRQEIILGTEEHPLFQDYFDEISKDQANAKKGQAVLIISDLCGVGSIYGIRAVNGRQLPEPTTQSRDAYKSYESCHLLWQIMDNEYHGRPLDFKEKSAVVDDESDNAPALIYPAGYQEFPEVAITHINQISQQYAGLAARVTQQPQFTGRGCSVKNAKVLPCQSRDDSLIVHILTDNANQTLPQEQQWFLKEFLGNRFSIEGNPLQTGLQLWMNTDRVPCDITTLQEKYSEIIAQLQVGWQPAKLIKHQDILHTQSEEEYALFRKKRRLRTEEGLLSCIACKFHIDKKIDCHSSWCNDPRNNRRDDMYLWIRKDALNQVVDMLGLQILPLPDADGAREF